MLPSAQLYVHIPVGRGQRGVRVSGPDRRDGFGVVGVVMRERDPAEPAPTLELGDERVDVLVEIRPGVDEPRGVPADDPGVRSAERERSRVRRADPDEIVSGDVEARHSEEHDTTRCGLTGVTFSRRRGSNP